MFGLFKKIHLRLFVSTAVASLLYFIAFSFIFHAIGNASYIVGLVIPVVAGWFGNARAGFFLGFLPIIINCYFGYEFGFNHHAVEVLPSLIMMPLVGAIVGHYRYLNFLLKREVVHRLQVETQLIRHRTKLVESARFVAVGQMAGTIAHDISNPVMITEGIVDRLKKLSAAGTLTKEKLTECLDKILATTQRISRVVKGVSAIARGGGDENFEPADVEALLDEVVDLTRESFRNRFVDLQINNQCGTAFVNCQRIQISQVVLNLLNNSLDAVEKLKERWVRIDVTKNLDILEISVTDSGKGIAPQVRDKLLQPYFTTKTSVKSMGLGLKISKLIMDRHKGEIILDENSSNTRFVLRLKLLEVDHQIIEDRRYSA